MRNRVIWVFVFIIVLVPVLSEQSQAEKKKNNDDYYELMKTFVDTFEQIERNYVKDVDRRKLMEAAIRGMLEELDQYSSYISPEEISQFEQQVDQEFGGVGIQVFVDRDTKRLTVMTPLPGTPAYKAGIRAGDVIMEINKKSTEGFTISQAVDLLKGKPGEAVTIGVRHPDQTKIDQIEVVRDVIHVATVLGDYYDEEGNWNYMLQPDEKIGYIRLTHFSRKSSEELRAVIEKLLEDGMKGLILDLRFNPGGLLDQATAISDMFIEKGKIVSTKGKNSAEHVWTAKKEGTFPNFPMVVLVNHFSASASEILSACLQDHNRAVIVGERTWGKGSVQNVIDLENGSSALKLTTASYHRPSGKNIHRFPGAKESDEWGVMPDENYTVKLNFEDVQKYLRYRRERDVIKKGGPPKEEFLDAQLEKAVDYLKKQKPETKAADQKKDDKETKKKAAQRNGAGRLNNPKSASRNGRLPLLPVKAA